jgi:hypothetical protein
MRIIAALALAAVAACAAEKPVVLPAVDPGQTFLDELETRLLRAKTVHVQGRAGSTGAIASDLAFELFLGDGQKARLEAKGTFAGKPVDAWFVCDGTSMAVRGKEKTAAAPEVRDAVVVGLVRMGILHNLARLSGGDAPDHADGHVRDFVRAERGRAGEPATDVTYDVVVRHKVMGEAVLSLTAEAKPKARTAVVRFDEGEMKATEQYDLVELDVPIDDSVFALE